MISPVFQQKLLFFLIFLKFHVDRSLSAGYKDKNQWEIMG